MIGLLGMRGTMKDKYQKFWDWFLDNEKFIWNNIEKDSQKIGKLIDENLKKVNEDLAFDIYFEVHDGKRDFIISADGIEKIFPEVINLYEKSPKCSRWNIIAFRPKTNQKDQCIEIDALCLDYEKIYFKHNFNSIPFDIDVYIENYDGKDNRYVHGYFLLLDTLIGEYEAVTSIRKTNVYPLKPEQKSELTKFIKLRDIVDELNIKQ